MDTDQRPPLDLRTAHACPACAELYRTRREADLCRELPPTESVV